MSTVTGTTGACRSTSFQPTHRLGTCAYRRPHHAVGKADWLRVQRGMTIGCRGSGAVHDFTTRLGAAPHPLTLGVVEAATEYHLHTTGVECLSRAR
jgi:hypothetical protein